MAEDGGSKVVYFLAGLAVGAFVGLVVIAPKSGKETRDSLAKRAEEGREYASRKGRELRERAAELTEECFAAGPHGPGLPPPEDDDDEPRTRQSNVD